MNLPITELLVHRPPHHPRGVLRRGRDRPRVDPPVAGRAARRGGQPRRPPGPPPARRSRPVPGGLPDRPDLPRASSRRPTPPSASSTGSPACSQQIPAIRGVGGRDRPRHRDHPAGPVHDRLRRAGPEDARPGPPRAVRARPVGADRRPRPGPRAARLVPDLGDAHGHRRPSGNVDRGQPDHRRGAPTHRRAGRPAGDPRGRGGADDQRGHRARRPAPPRGHGPADRHRRAAGDGHLRAGDRHDRRTRATAGSRSTRSRSTRSSGSSTPRTCCRTSRVRPRRGPTSG